MRISKRKPSENGIDNKVNILVRIANMINQYGIKKVISSLIIFILLIVVSIVFINQKVIVERIIAEQRQAYQTTTAKQLQFRVQAVNPRVDAILYKILAETHGDRAFVFEMHNGVDNPSGLPFAYADMSYERTITDSIAPVMSENRSLNLTNYPMATYLMIYKSFRGTVEDVKAIDKRLASKLSDCGAKYIILYSIRGNDIALGMVGVTYITNKPNQLQLSEASLLDASQRLSILLDINNNIEGKTDLEIIK